MFLPWKLLFRFFSALVLLATGGFAAGHDIPLPFTSPPAATAPAAAPGSTTTTAPAANDGSTTTTTAPASTPADPAPPVVATPVPDPAPTTSTTVTTAPAKHTTTTTTAPAPGDTPPVVPVPGNAPSVCAAAAAPTCGPAAPTQAADHAARVKACQDWWNSLADAFAANNRPEWAAQARQIAGQCDALITRWEQLQQQWEQHHAKGDHNADGHPDDGKGPKADQGGDHTPPPPPAKPLAKPVPHHGEARH